MSCVEKATISGVAAGGGAEELPFGMTSKLKSSDSAGPKSKGESKPETVIDGGGGDSESAHDSRSWSTVDEDDEDDATSSDSADVDVKDKLEEILEEKVVEPEPWNCVGIKAWDWAPSNQSACFVCNMKILKHEFRMDHRLKQSEALADQKRFHGHCVAGIPPDTRIRDIAVVRGFICDPTLAIDATPKLQEVLDILVSL